MNEAVEKLYEASRINNEPPQVSPHLSEDAKPDESMSLPVLYEASRTDHLPCPSRQRQREERSKKRRESTQGGRQRATRDDMERRKVDLWDIVAEQQPMTVRQVFYQATVRGVVEKTEAGYDKVQRALADMRRDGDLPWGWIADNTRWQRKPTTYDSLAEALEQTAKFYRRSGRRFSASSPPISHGHRCRPCPSWARWSRPSC